MGRPSARPFGCGRNRFGVRWHLGFRDSSAAPPSGLPQNDKRRLAGFCVTTITSRRLSAMDHAKTKSHGATVGPMQHRASPRIRRSTIRIAPAERGGARKHRGPHPGILPAVTFDHPMSFRSEPRSAKLRNLDTGKAIALRIECDHIRSMAARFTNTGLRERPRWVDPRRGRSDGGRNRFGVRWHLGFRDSSAAPESGLPQNDNKAAGRILRNHHHLA